MNCPNCGSNNVETFPETITETRQTGSDYDPMSACCGVMLFGWYGLLCGLCGGDKKTTTTHKTKMVNVCQDCGKRF
ncbi:MAG: hypothetical protein IJR47_03490 [Clostridia bacterium]|nr:hypothetical protein [Clostridia bacterium]